jgi:hypothetical protein
MSQETRIVRCSNIARYEITTSRQVEQVRQPVFGHVRIRHTNDDGATWSEVRFSESLRTRWKSFSAGLTWPPENVLHADCDQECLVLKFDSFDETHIANAERRKIWSARYDPRTNLWSICRNPEDLPRRA